MPTIERDTILKRINGIQEELAELLRLGKIPLADFDVFLSGVKNVLGHPERFGLTVG